MTADIGADVWLVRNGVTGPFTIFSPIPAEIVDSIPDGSSRWVARASTRVRVTLAAVGSNVASSTDRLEGRTASYPWPSPRAFPCQGCATPIDGDALVSARPQRDRSLTVILAPRVARRAARSVAGRSVFGAATASMPSVRDRRIWTVRRAGMSPDR